MSPYVWPFCPHSNTSLGDRNRNFSKCSPKWRFLKKNPKKLWLPCICVDRINRSCVPNCILLCALQYSTLKLRTNCRDSKGDIKCAAMARSMLASEPGNANTPLALRRIWHLLGVYHFTLNFWTFLIVRIAHFLILLSVNRLCALMHLKLSSI